MRKVYKKRDEDAVSPVIATILMVAITVVLAAVLYVMVIGMGGGGDTIETPLGMNKTGTTPTSVTYVVSSAPNDARIDSTSISLTSGGNPQPISTATVYTSGAIIMATYDGASWTYPNANYTATTAMFNNGVTIVIEAGSINSGDKIVFSSGNKYYGTTTVTV